MKKDFISPERFQEEIQKKILSGPNGWISFVACNEGLRLARSVKREYDKLLATSGSKLTSVPLLNDREWNGPHDAKLVKRVGDTETIPRLEAHVAGSNVYVFQSVHELRSGNTVNENLFQLGQMIRTLKVQGAKSITAVMPYHPYSRQDKPSFMKREATLAKFVADFMHMSGASSVLTYHPHSEGIRGFYEPSMRFTALNGLDLFIDITNKFCGLSDVACVSTDAGAAKFTIHYARALRVDYAVGNKFRPKQEKTDILGIIGNVEGKRIAILGDDETVSFTSLMNAAAELHDRYKVEEIYMLVSHNKIRPENVGKIVKSREQYGLQELHVTDTVPQQDDVLDLPFVTVHSLGERFARTINRLHYNQSVSGLFYKPKD
jgi:ribose-phosphate pyrophosphokinase